MPAWLTYLADEPTAPEFAPAVKTSARLVVPAVCLVDVFKVAARQRDEGAALRAVALMQHGQVVVLDEALALSRRAEAFDDAAPGRRVVDDRGDRVVPTWPRRSKTCCRLASSGTANAPE